MKPVTIPEPIVAWFREASVEEPMLASWQAPDHPSINPGAVPAIHWVDRDMGPCVSVVLELEGAEPDVLAMGGWLVIGWWGSAVPVFPYPVVLVERSEMAMYTFEVRCLGCDWKLRHEVQENEEMGVVRTKLEDEGRAHMGGGHVVEMAAFREIGVAKQATPYDPEDVSGD